jgi:flagellar biosynthesis protein FlhA
MPTRRLSSAVIPFAILMVVVVMVVPLPVVMIDMLLALNLTVAIMILLTSMLVREPLEFSVFPSLLLITTMFRLALAVSTTRLILSKGEGGKVIHAFGTIVVSGNLIIGLVIFVILIVIQFAVVTSGAGRVAEVGARFTLDAMPGKQMAIDADLNAGLITENEARRRRQHVAREADFYGSMDGASKFIKGDAIAAVVIVMVNLFGGIAVGVLQHGLSVTDSISKFSLLSIGDGLVSQIPALLISVASGVIVTRSTTDEEGGLGVDLASQLFRNKKVMAISAAAVCALGLLPGLPKPPFLFLAAVLLIARSRVSDRPLLEEEEVAVAPLGDDEVALDLNVEPLELDLSLDLLDLVDPAYGATLLDRVRALRRSLALELGLVVPLVRTRDDVLLTPTNYSIRVNGVESGRGEAPTGQVMVLAGDGDLAIVGKPTTEPVFGLPAFWVPDAMADHYRARGATVVDRSSVIVTHLAEIVRRNAASLLSRQDTHRMVEAVRTVAPVVAEGVGAAGVTLADVHDVLCSLLSEGVPIRDLVRILEALTAKPRDTRDHDTMVECARQAVAGAICAQHAPTNHLKAITIEPALEFTLLQSRRMGENGWFFDLDGARMEKILRALSDAIIRSQSSGSRPVIVCAPAIRPVVRRLTGGGAGSPAVLSYNELVPSVTVESVEVIDVGRVDATI